MDIACADQAIPLRAIAAEKTSAKDLFMGELLDAVAHGKESSVT
jgi:hypothetical protein